MTMIKLKVCDLSGTPLDWATAYAIDQEVFTDGGSVLRFGALALPWAPSTNWAQGGLLVDQYGVSLTTGDAPTEQGIAGNLFTAMMTRSSDFRPFVAHGKTRLIAACRAIVASKLGETVEMPVELLSEEQLMATMRTNTADFSVPCCNWPKCGCEVMHGDDCVPF